MRSNDLIRCVWTGQTLAPDGSYTIHQLNDRLGVGEIVNVDLDPERPAKSHKHQFAFVRTAWQNLPEHLKDAPYAKSAETLRNHALIINGYCATEMKAIDCERRAERVAGSMSRLAIRISRYAVTNIEGSVAYCHPPHSQNQRSMGARALQASKQTVVEWMSDLIGVTPDQLANTGKKKIA
ncbi:hypothetical protein DL239_21115 [Sedimentitalea sp. CY04]|uniref:Uncharacterized protein n=1 Tax=Parasedimentitalea denitrificans TaxID=2211118 RepID=A0ABX0WDS4_9RHOB|nr:hypothetical protein [Sedimentitalea sp. CY04]NIZ63467.1 hypothetical protein [Sedimentitalea sp. CY04]